MAWAAGLACRYDTHLLGQACPPSHKGRTLHTSPRPPSGRLPFSQSSQNSSRVRGRPARDHSFSRSPDTCGWPRGSQLRAPFPSHRPDVADRPVLVQADALRACILSNFPYRARARDTGFVGQCLGYARSGVRRRPARDRARSGHCRSRSESFGQILARLLDKWLDPTTSFRGGV